MLPSAAKRLAVVACALAPALMSPPAQANHTPAQLESFDSADAWRTRTLAADGALQPVTANGKDGARTEGTGSLLWPAGNRKAITERLFDAPLDLAEASGLTVWIMERAAAPAGALEMRLGTSATDYFARVIPQLPGFPSTAFEQDISTRSSWIAVGAPVWSNITRLQIAWTSATASPELRFDDLRISADQVGYLEQAGDGHGRSAPMAGLAKFKLGAIVHSPVHFSDGTTSQQGKPKFLAWGTPDDQTQLVMLNGGEDGTLWTSPAPATLGNSPFNIAKASSFDVVWIPTGTYHFVILYTPVGADPFATSAVTGSSTATNVDALHTAASTDGVHWINDRPIQQQNASPVINGAAGSFNKGVLGATDVVFNRDGSAQCAAGVIQPNFPWNCPYIMIYLVIDGSGGNQSLAIAGSPGFQNDQTMLWRGFASPIFSPGGAGAWDSGSVDGAHVRCLPVTGWLDVTKTPPAPNPFDPCLNSTGYELYYAGHSGSTSSIGVATSSDGHTFARLTTSGPATPSGLYDSFFGGSSQLLNPISVDDANGSGHGKIYLTRERGTNDAAFLAFTAPAPLGAEPVVRISSPVTSQGATVTLDAFLNDSTGNDTNPQTIRVMLDGEILGGIDIEASIVGAITRPGFEVRLPHPLGLSDGFHTFEISAEDRDGDLVRGRAISTFLVDRTPPVTTQTRAPTDPQTGVLSGIGEWSASTSDTATDGGGTPLARVMARVTDPLGRVATYIQGGASGFRVTRTSAKDWTWTWVSPTLDQFFLTPGTYTVSLLAVDGVGNVERTSPSNTGQILVV